MGISDKTIENAINALWAKKSEKQGRYFWLPLTVHLEDTMNVAGWLFEHWLSQGQREYILNNNNGVAGNEDTRIDCDTALSVVKFLGGIHDLGKATPVFQIEKGNSPEDLNQILLEHLEQAGYEGISDLRLTEPEKSRHALAGEYLLQSRFGIREDIASIVGAHHGKPADSTAAIDGQTSYTANYYQQEVRKGAQLSGTALLWDSVREHIFNHILNLSGFDSVSQLPELSQPSQVVLSGLLIMADWISSNERYYPLIPADSTDIRTDAGERLRRGITEWSTSFGCHELNQPEGAEELYEDRFGFSPRKFQKTIFDIISSLSDPGILIIEAPTGSGKTEAALAAAEQMAASDERSGLFFGLPTQATSDGIFSRVLNWAEKMSQENGDSSIHLVHGKAGLNEDFAKLRKRSASNVDVDSPGEGSVTVNEWFSGRKTASLDDFVVGTVDQFLMMALKQKHFQLRHLGFSKKVIVIDEVHAYDAYMQQYLGEALRWAGAYHTPVILLSATLSSELRKKLLESYMKGRGEGRKELKAQLESLDSSYPMITFSDGSELKTCTDFQAEASRTVRIHRAADDDCCELIDHLIRDGGIVGIILNTVRRAQELAQKCADRFGRDTVELVHAGFTATDRSRIENRLLKMIGKGADRPARKIIIGTQVLEQSLDIDFDVLITDLCPVDLLIQRIGRLQRHDIQRPESLKTPEVYVLGTSDTWEFEKGSGYIYSDYLLARTQSLLPKELHVPDDISELVQKVYDSEAWEDLNAPEVLSERYHGITLDKKSADSNEKSKAGLYRLNDPKNKVKPEKNNLTGMLETSASDSEAVALAQVRDTQETVEVIALRKVGAGYGTFSDGIDISDHLEDPKAALDIASQTLRLPQSVTGFGRAGKVIRDLEEYNREHLALWQRHPRLKGELGIIFDEDNTFDELAGCTLIYDEFLGLKVQRKEEK